MVRWGLISKKYKWRIPYLLPGKIFSQDEGRSGVPIEEFFGERVFRASELECFESNIVLQPCQNLTHELQTVWIGSIESEVEVGNFVNEVWAEEPDLGPVRLVVPKGELKTVVERNLMKNQRRALSSTNQFLLFLQFQNLTRRILS